MAKAVNKYKEAAMAAFGHGCPLCTGYVFSTGERMSLGPHTPHCCGRGSDHRTVTGLLPSDHPGLDTRSRHQLMLDWMDLAHACRVSVYLTSDRTDISWVFIELPPSKEACAAFLPSSGRYAILEFLEACENSGYGILEIELAHNDRVLRRITGDPQIKLARVGPGIHTLLKELTV